MQKQTMSPQQTVLKQTVPGKTLARLVKQHRLLDYSDDPLTLYQSLTGDGADTLLLESAEIDSKDHLKSIIMTAAALRITARGYDITFEALSNNGAQLLPRLQAHFGAQSHLLGQCLTVTLARPAAGLDEDSRLKAGSPLDALRTLLSGIDCGADVNVAPAFEDLFLGGVLAYDLIDAVEPLPQVEASANTCPDFLFYLAETLILVDHQSRKAELISAQYACDTAADTEIAAELETRCQAILQQCAEPVQLAELKPVQAEVRVDVSDEAFMAKVDALKQHIIAGDIFQVVPSRSFSLPCPNPLGAYRALKRSNPSPYMFYFRGPDFTLFGASPESALKYQAHNNQVEIYPIAGTRKRGKKANGEIDFDLDSRIELELRLDKKELSEHLMLVDLARNDIARISESGSRKVAELLKVDRYSHVMHLVSRVTGSLRNDLDALHAYQACMNMGTLTGAPKVRASQLIREVEQQRRGSYGGAVGYLNGLGDMDTCIVIRSAFVKDGLAHIQAGAGVVYDSDPRAEAEETSQKAQAVIAAIKMGGGL
ncbi:anthranilate synthase component 1 [Shewanella cyperi]|nr:anthranilate synthase component 1 [Shewanella cyperi]